MFLFVLQFPGKQWYIFSIWIDYTLFVKKGALYSFGEEINSIFLTS